MFEVIDHIIHEIESSFFLNNLDIFFHRLSFLPIYQINGKWLQRWNFEIVFRDYGFNGALHKIFQLFYPKLNPAFFNEFTTQWYTFTFSEIKNLSLFVFYVNLKTL